MAEEIVKRIRITGMSMAPKDGRPAPSTEQITLATQDITEGLVRYSMSLVVNRDDVKRLSIIVGDTLELRLTQLP